MKEILIVISAGLIMLCTARPAPAVMTEYSTTNRYVAVTNVLPATEVHPLAAYVIFPAPSTGTVSISRVSRGVVVPLSRHGFTNVAALTWLPPADYPIRRGEAFAVSSTVARFTLQLESSNDGGDIQRTDAPEWFDDGRAFTAQGTSGGGGSTTVIVTNTAQLFVTNAANVVVTNSQHVTVTNIANIVVSNSPHFTVTNSATVIVTNAPHFVITNIVNVSTGGGGGPQFDVGMSGEYKATNNIIVSNYGENQRLIWYDGSSGSLKYNNSTFVFQGNGSYEYNVNFGFDSSPNNGDVLTYDAMSATWTHAAPAGGGGSALPSPWFASATGAGLLITNNGPNMAGSLQLGNSAFGTVLQSDTHTLSLWGDGNPIQIDGVTVNFGAGNDNDVWTYTAAAGWHAASLWVTAPASASASGTPGQIAYDGSYLYVCVATDTWVRTALSTW